MDYKNLIFNKMQLSQLSGHFAKIIKNGECMENDKQHIEYYEKSINRYIDYCDKKDNIGKHNIETMKLPCQIEKDERFWTALYLMNIYHSKNREERLIGLFKKAYNNSPPINNLKSWKDCFNGDLYLFFERRG